jgi:hypothetical protein
VAVVLAAGLYAGTAAAEDRKQAPPSGTREPAAEKSTRLRQPGLSAEDQEVVENLELLESMDEAEDLELLMELSKEEED